MDHNFTTHILQVPNKANWVKLLKKLKYKWESYTTLLCAWTYWKLIASWHAIESSQVSFTLMSIDIQNLDLYLYKLQTQIHYMLV